MTSGCLRASLQAYEETRLISKLGFLAGILGTPGALLESFSILCHHAGMSEHTPLEQAQENLAEAVRQYEKAKGDHARGDISQARLAQLEELKDIAATDLQRVLREQ